ncbi:sulfotransferase domain-containing protein [Lichenicola sp.]|uniref:sulfotransferase domain-containing protein n=1 Tax=Lichenicola sp. TaxID=2804529 RepID=UPI003B000E79
MWLLGRVPSADEIAANRAHYAGSPHDDVHDFKRHLLRSAEFRTHRLRAHTFAPDTSLDLAAPRLVFLHIPKCGGTTLHAMLSTQFAAERICPERNDTLGDWTINELAAYDLFSGHFDVAPCRSIPGRLRMLTLLREPKARLMSLYYFWKSHRPHPDRDAYEMLLLARSMSPEAFFDHPVVVRHARIRNAMTVQLARTSICRLLAPDDPILADPDAALEQAWATLRDLACFGIMERFEDSRMLLNATLGLSMPQIEPRQVLDRLVVTDDQLVLVQRVPMSPALDALLDTLTTIDRPLYARALALFEQRLAGNGMRTPASAGLDPEPPSLIRQVTGLLRRSTGSAGATRP